MEDEPKTFTNRELWMLIDKNNQTNLLQHKSLLDSQTEFHNTVKETLSLILAQTSKTNGRVNNLELWRSYVKGSTFIIPIVISALVGGLVTFLIKFL
jgi:hypothetical protein